MKSPGLAAVLSFFYPGLGQIYNGQILKGVFTFVAHSIALFLIVFVVGFFIFPLIWIWSMYDAYSTAERINRSGFRY